MQIPTTLSSRPKGALFVVFASMFTLGSLGSFPSRTSADGVPRAEISSTGAQASTVPIHKQRIRVWVQGDDIRPRVIHARPGLVLLMVENETARDVDLVVAQSTPNQQTVIATTITVLARRKRVTTEITLVLGEYIIYERTQPRRKAILRVSQQ